MQKVTQEQAEYMLETVPPTVWFKTAGGGQVFQVGEAMDIEDGKETFGTYEQHQGQWYFMGYKHKIKVHKDRILMESQAYSHI